MEFNFAHLYSTEVVEVKKDGKVAFTAIVQQVSHGEKEKAKAIMLSSVEIPIEGSKARRQREMKNSMKSAMQNGAITDMSIYEEVAAIQSWTLQTAEGVDVPVCAEAWQALPSAMTSQIVEAIERLNPDLDDEFHNGNADESADE